MVKPLENTMLYQNNLLKRLQDSKKILTCKQIIKKYHLKEFRPRLTASEYASHKMMTKKENRVLVIGDPHEPFSLDGYLEFCVGTCVSYNCNRIVFIGDIIDNHYSSYHETDADGMGGGEELDFAVKRISRWYNAFPDADVLIGNHDRIVARKAQTSNIPKKWLKSYQEVLEVPNWRFHEELEIDGVNYNHGEGSKAHIKARKNMQSTVQGHHHTDCYVQWFVGSSAKIFGMQVGCGIDRKAYAMAYAKNHPKQAIGCGVVIGGHTAINVMMEL